MSRRRHSLGDVPHRAVAVERQQSVRRRHAVKLGFLLVPEEDVRRPDVVPGAVRQLDRRPVDALVDERFVDEPVVRPLLTQVHVERVVLLIVTSAIKLLVPAATLYRGRKRHRLRNSVHAFASQHTIH